MFKAVVGMILEGLAKAMWKYMVLQRSIKDRQAVIDDLIKEHSKSIEWVKNNKELSDAEKDAILIESARRIVFGP